MHAPDKVEWRSATRGETQTPPETASQTDLDVAQVVHADCVPVVHVVGLPHQGCELTRVQLPLIVLRPSSARVCVCVCVFA